MWEKVQEQIRSGKRTGKGSAARRRLPIYNSRETMDETDARLEREMQTRRLREKHARDAAWEQARYEQTMRGAREKYQREHAAEKQQRELEERLGYRVPEHAKRTSPLTETALLAQVYEEKAPERRRYLLQRGMNDKQQQELEARADFERFRNDPLMGRFAAQQAGGHAPLAADSFAQQQGQGLPAQLRDMGLARADAYRAAQPAAAEVSAEQVMRKYDPAELDNARRVRAEAARTLGRNRETLADMERIHRTVGRHQGSTAALSPEDAAKYEYWREMGTKPEAVMAEIRAGEAQVQNEDAIIRRQGWKDTADVDARRAARLSGRLTEAEAALVRNPQAGTLGAAEALRELYAQRAGLQAELAALDRPGEAGALKVQDVERTRSRVAAELQEVEADIRAGEYALEALRPETMAARAAGEEMGRASGKGLPYLLSLPMAQRAELARRAQYSPDKLLNIAPVGSWIVLEDNNLIRRAAVMTPREVQTYQALLGGKGAEEADAYMETLRPRLEKRVADAEAREWAERAGTPLGAWLESAGSVLATVGEPAGMLMTGLNALTGRETTPYDPAFTPTRYKQVVRDTVKAGQREQFGDGFLGNLMNLGYDVVTSAGDSTLSMGLGGSVGGGLLMAGASGSGKVWEELLEGRDSRRALTAGMAAALTEGLTEHMGMERVGNVFRAGKNAGSYRLLLTQAARGFLSEALEEAPGPVVDRAVDAWLNPRNNDRTRRVQELVSGGMTPDEAIARTDAEFLLDMGYGMLAGGLSGGMMQGVAGAAGVTRAKSYERAMVKAGAAEADARVAAQQLAGIREDAEGEKALDAVAAQMQAQEDRQGEGHTPFQAAARSAGAPVQVVGVAALTEDGMEVELDGGGKAGLDSIQFEKEDVEAAYRHAAAYGDAQTARQYLAGYEASALPETLYHAGFQAAYEAGRNSRPMTEAERVKRHGGMLEPEVYRLAYQAGRDATAAQEVRLALPEALGEEIRTRIGQLPRTYAQGYTGVVYAAKMTRPTKAQAVMIDLLDAYGKAHGVHYTVVDTIGDGGANGVYSDGDGMVVALDAEEGYLTRVATHEGWHYIRSQLGTEAQALQDTVLELLQNTEGYDLEARIREKQEQYKRMQGQELSREDALEELTADALYDAIAKPEGLRRIVSRAYDNATGRRKKNAFLAALDKMMDFINNFVAEIRALAKKLAGKNPEAQAMLKHEEDWATDILRAYDQLMEKAGKREAQKKPGGSKRNETFRSSLKTEDNGGRYDYSKPFAQQVQDWIDGKIPERDTLLLGKTPELYRKIGLSNLPLTIDQTHVDYAINGTKNADHQLGAQLLQQLPQLLEDPVAIIESGTRPGDSVMVIVQGTVQDKQICAPIWISGTGRQNKIAVDSNRVTSVQGRSNAVTKLLTDAIEKENAGLPGVYYINKTEARSLYDRAGVQFPGGHLQDGLIHSIFDAGAPVNRKYMEQKDTRQFKRWFGKSKVVNADGSPKVMYHGTKSGAFEVFDPELGNKRVRLNTLGTGNYFASDRKSAQRYGERVIEAYVSLQNPYIVTPQEGGLKAQIENEFGIELESRRDIQEELRKRGYDGVILYEPGTEKEIRTAVAFDSTQIKSATDNVGTFDPENPNIHYSLRNVDEDVLYPVEGATVENHAGVFAAQRERLVAWTDGKPKSAKAVRELVGESMTPTLEKWLHNQYEKGQNRRIAEPVYREAVEAFLKRDEAQIAANDAKSKAFWAKLRKESVQLHEVKAGANTHEGRGAVGREVVQELMGDAPRVVVHNRDAQVDIYVNRDSVSKTLSYGSNHNTPIGISKAILLKTKEMLADAKYIGSREDYTGNGGQVHYFVSAAQTGNEIRRVVYMAHEAEGRNGSHLYVEEVELLDTKNTGALDTSRPRFPAGAQALTSNHPGTISIPELLQNFNTEFLRWYDLKERGGQKPLQFSLRNVDEDMAEMQRVMEENERLRELVGKLNDTLSAERGNGKHIDRKAVRKIAREMKKEYQSTVSVDDLAANLQKAFDAMASAQSTGDAESAMAAMGAIAKDMLEKSDETDTVMYDEYRELRDYLRKGRMGLTGTQWAEAENLYGSGKSFRKAVFGRWTVAGKEDRSATDLSQRWGEMCERWPEMFDADASEGDMVQQVLDALDATAKTHRNPFDMNMKEMVQYVTAEIYGAYMQAPTLNRDAAWRQEEREKREALTRELGEARQELEQGRAEIAAAREEMQDDWQWRWKRMDQAREEVLEARREAGERVYQAQEETANIIKAAHETNQRIMREANERANERADQQIEKWRKAREVNAELRRDRLEVIRQKARILRQLNRPTQNSFVPYQMRDAVRTLMEALDYREENKVVLKREMLEAALAAYNAVLPQTDGSGEAREDTGNIPLAAFWDGDAAQAMEELAKTADGKKLNQLSPEETRKLLEVLRAYAAMLINENRLFTQGKKETLQKAGGEMIAAMVQRKEHRQHRPGVENLLNVVNRGMLSPGTVFHTVEDTPMGSIWARLREAEGVHTRHVQEGAAYLAEALEKYHAQELVDMSEKKQLEKGVEVALAGGKQKFRVQELMYLYAAMKREKLVGTNHLLGGGIEFQTGSHPGERIGVRTLTESDLNAIQNALTEEQKAFVDHMVRYLSTTTAEWGNQVTRELYGVEKFNEKYYVPFQVSRNALSSDPAKQQENRLKLGRFTKSLTQQARNPLIVQNFIEMWAVHVEQMSDYNAFVLPIEDMTRLINYRDFGDGDQLGMTVREAMRWGMGNQIPDYIMEFLRRLNGNAKAELGGRTVNRLIGAAKGAAVGANLSVAIQQATAVLRAYALVDAKYLGRGMLAGVNPAKLKKTYAQIEQWAPIATQKSWGYFDTNMSRGLYDRARQDMQTKLNDRLGFLSQKGDELAFVMIWEAVKREVADRPGMTRGTDEYFRACGARFTEIVDQTQVVDSIFQRAELATEKGLSKIWTAFMSEPFKQYNLLWRAVWDLKEARASGNRAAIQRAGKQLGRSVGAVAMSSAAAAAMKSIISAMRDRDNEKEEKDENGKTVVVGVRTFGDKYWDALWVNLLDNVWGVMPIFGNMIGALITGERYSGSSMDSAALNSMIALGKAIEQGNVEDAVYRALQVASNVTGVAVGNLYRDAKALALTAVDLMRRDTLAGAAWDKAKPMDVRLKAAAKNYVYAKQPGDGRKASPELYFDLLLDAWYSGGMGAGFQAVATEMLATGATVSGIKSGFKRRLRGCEQKVTAAADAMEAGDLDRYEELVGEVMAMGIGKAAVVSMVRSELEGRKPKEAPPQSWELLEAELVGEDAGLYATDDLLAALDRGEMEQAKELADRLSEEKDEGSLRASLTGAYKAPYLAAWKAGDAQEMERIRSMLLGLDVGYTAEMLDKWTQAELSGDYREAVESGDAGEIWQAVAALRDAGATDKELRSRLTEDYRQNYMEAWRQGDRAQTASTEKLLEGLGVGYDAEIFRGWRLDSLEDDWEEAVAAQDAGKLRSAADRQKAAGRTDKQVRDKVWAAYGKAWEKALWSGDTAGAARLAKVMTGSGTGWEQADLDKRAVDDAFGYYYDHVKTGELQEARSVLGYLRRAVAEDAMWKRLYGWAKGQMKKLEGKEAEAFAGSLIRMGFSEKTVAGWRE